MGVTLHAGKIVCLDAADSIYSPGSIQIEEGRIKAIGPRGQMPAATPNQVEIELGNRLLMPGLINAHTHSPMTLFRGMAEGHSLFTFDGWYNTIRVVEEQMSPDMLPPAVTVSCAEMIRTGTTTFADQYFWMEQIAPAVRASGLRAALAYGIVELGDESARHRELSAATDFLSALDGDSRLTSWIGPHAFFVDNSEEAMQQELALAAQFETGLHIHFATSGEEDRYCHTHYNRSAVAQLAKMGILERPILAAHCLTLSSIDYPTLVNTPFSAVIAPSSAMRNAAGAADVLGMMHAGINLALGTDNVTNNNSYDMFKEMQLAGKLYAHHYRQPNALPTRAILHMASLGGAKALGLQDEIGSLEVGKKADIISLDLDEIGWAPIIGQDIYTALVYAVSGMHVRDVMVDGNWLYRDGEWQTIDYKAAKIELNDACRQLNDRLAQSIHN